MVDNGKKVRFWKDAGIEVKPLKLIARPQVPNELQSLKVVDYWQAGRGWDWHLIRSYLTANTLLKLASTVVTEADGDEDSLV